MSGRLGAADLAATTNTLLYTCLTGKVATVNINMCNRSAGLVNIRVAVADSGTPANEHWIEYDEQLNANTSYERKGVVLSAGQTIVVYSSAINMSAQVWGWVEDA